MGVRRRIARPAAHPARVLRAAAPSAAVRARTTGATRSSATRSSSRPGVWAPARHPVALAHVGISPMVHGSCSQIVQVARQSVRGSAPSCSGGACSTWHHCPALRSAPPRQCGARCQDFRIGSQGRNRSHMSATGTFHSRNDVQGPAAASQGAVVRAAQVGTWGTAGRGRPCRPPTWCTTVAPPSPRR